MEGRGPTQGTVEIEVGASQGRWERWDEDGGGAQSGYCGQEQPPAWDFLLLIVTTVLTSCYSSFSCPGTQIRFSWILAS